MTDVTLEPWQLRYAAVVLRFTEEQGPASKRALKIVAQFCEHAAEMMDKERHEP